MIDQNELYERLSEPFDITFEDTRGGVKLTYITGEQVTTRLNEELGVTNWNFRIIQHDIHPEADEIWVLGEMDALMDGQHVIKQQFGSQKIKRSRSTGAPLDIGFDLKGAATDAMKKCATLIGVGLYLSRKKAGPQNGRPVQNIQHSSNQQRITVVHTSPSDELLKKWDDTKEKAKKVGINVQDRKPETSAQVEQWISVLEQRVSEASAPTVA